MASKQPPGSAHKKVMDLLARREHSESEIRTKLACHYPTSEIEDAIAQAKQAKWLSDPTELASRVALSLHRRKKGYRYIAEYLKQKGLPAVAIDPQVESEKAVAMIQSKFPLADGSTYSRQDKQKIAQFLSRRGFDEDTIQRTIYEEL